MLPICTPAFIAGGGVAPSLKEKPEMTGSPSTYSLPLLPMVFVAVTVRFEHTAPRDGSVS